MSKPLTIPNAFQAQVGPIPLSQLDADFTAAANAINDTLSYSNYFVDSSGAPNTITVTVPAPLVFAYSTGVLLQVKLANTNTSTAVVINVNTLGNKTVVLNDGSAPPVGSLTANSILELMYDGANFRVLNQRGATIIGALTVNGPSGGTAITIQDGTVTSLITTAGPSLQIGTTTAHAASFYTNNTTRLQLAASAYSMGLGTLALPTTNTLDFMFTGAGMLAAQEAVAGELDVAWNAYYNTGWKYRLADVAGRLTFAGDAAGCWSFDTASSGAANGAITWTERMRVSTSQVLIGDGAVGGPGFSFLADTDTGIFRIAANDFRLVAGGTAALDIQASAISPLVPINNVDGSVSAPAYAFANDTTSGIFRSGSGNVSISVSNQNGISMTNAGAGITNWTLGSGLSTTSGININTTTTATAGAQTLPANPQGFIQILINGTQRRIPYYNP